MSRYLLIFLCAIIFHPKTVKCEYEIIVERIETAFGEDDKAFAFDTLRVKKFNRTTFVVNGKFTVKQDLGEDVDIHGAGFNLQGGQYKQMIEKSMENFCKSVYIEPSRTFFEYYQSHMTNPVPWKTCPYPAGENEVKNFLVDESLFLLPPYIPGGEKWKIEIRFSRKNEEFFGGYNIYVIMRSPDSLLDNI